MPPDPGLRASDGDRDRTVERLRQAYAEGRLTDAEFSERLAAALEARTYGELDALVADLPPAPEAQPRGAAAGDLRGRAGEALPGPAGDRWDRRAERLERRRDRLARRTGGPPGHLDRAGALRSWASTSVIVWAIWLAVLVTGGGLQGLWPVWVSVPWGAVLLARTLRGDHR